MIPVRVGHVPREISQFALFFPREGGAVSGIVLDTKHKPSPIPAGGL